MNNNTNKEQWIDDVLGSTQGISRAHARDGMYERVSLQLRSGNRVRSNAGSAKQWVGAAVILLALNVSSIIYFIGTRKSASDNPLSTEMQSVTTYNY